MTLKKIVPLPYLAVLDLGKGIEGVGKFQPRISSSASTKIYLGEFLSTLITAFTVIASLAFVIYFIMGAFKWITSSGDKNAVEEGKSQLTQGALGLIVVIISYFVVGLLGGVLGIDILNPGKILGL